MPLFPFSSPWCLFPPLLFRETNSSLFLVLELHFSKWSTHPRSKSPKPLIDLHDPAAAIRKITPAVLSQALQEQPIVAPLTLSLESGARGRASIVLSHSLSLCRFPHTICHVHPWTGDQRCSGDPAQILPRPDRTSFSTFQFCKKCQPDKKKNDACTISAAKHAMILVSPKEKKGRRQGKTHIYVRLRNIGRTAFFPS